MRVRPFLLISGLVCDLVTNSLILARVNFFVELEEIEEEVVEEGSLVLTFSRAFTLDFRKSFSALSKPIAWERFWSRTL